MGTIGGITMLRISGPQIPALATVMTAIERIGVDGATFRADGAKVPELTLRTVEEAADLSAANASSAAYQSLIGSLVTVVDDHSRSVSNVMVMAVIVERVQKLISSSSGADYAVFASWLVKPTA